MKTMTCNQLGGPTNCNKKFSAQTFEEIAKMSKEHGIEMFQQNDKSHLEAMEKMKKIMQNPQDMQKWFENKKKNLKHYLKTIKLETYQILKEKYFKKNKS